MLNNTKKINNLLFRISLLSLFILINTSCSTKNHLSSHQTQFIVFGTEVNITIYSDNPKKSDQAIQDIQARFYQFHQDWHAWEEGGIVSKINQAIKSQQTIVVAEDVKAFIVKSQQLAQESNYLFDPAIGKLIQLWGFHGENWQGSPPSELQLQEWLNNRPSIANLQFDGLILSSTNPNVALDFGGNAKGLALDIAITTLKLSGIKNAIVNIGGDMRIIGNKYGKKNTPWVIGINNPFTPNQPLASINLQGDESIVTSGGYQRYFIWQGQRYSHIINPNTALPADNFASVTVIHSDATRADAAATAIMIAGHKQWQQIAKQMGIAEVLMIDQDQRIIMSPQMRDRIQIFNK